MIWLEAVHVPLKIEDISKLLEIMYLAPLVILWQWQAHLMTFIFEILTNPVVIFSLLPQFSGDYMQLTGSLFSLQSLIAFTHHG